jgi:hypothetical protein
MRRLVEAELLFQLLDELRVEALRAAILEAAFGGRACACGLPAANFAAARSTANAGRGSNIGALQLGQHPFHRAARGKLDDRKRNQHDAEQRRDHQQKPFEDVATHVARPIG